MCFSQESEDFKCKSSAKKLIFNFSRISEEMKKRKNADIDVNYLRIKNYIKASGIETHLNSEDLTKSQYHLILLGSCSEALRFLLEAETEVLKEQKEFFFMPVVMQIAKKVGSFPECLLEEYTEFHKIKNKFMEK